MLDVVKTLQTGFVNQIICAWQHVLLRRCASNDSLLEVYLRILYIVCYVRYVFLPVHEDAPCMSVAMKCSCVWATLSARLTAVYLLSVVVKLSPWGRLWLRLYYSVAVPPQESVPSGPVVKHWSWHLQYSTGGSPHSVRYHILQITKYFRLQTSILVAQTVWNVSKGFFFVCFCCHCQFFFFLNSEVN